MKKIETICIIDDDPITVFGIKYQIKKENICHNFLEYSNGEEAINGLGAIVNANKKIPFLILLDINMPIMDGWQFLEEFIAMKTQQKIDIYIVTSSINIEDKKRARTFNTITSHNIHYLIKPFNKPQMQEIINNISV